MINIVNPFISFIKKGIQLCMSNYYFCSYDFNYNEESYYSFCKEFNYEHDISLFKSNEYELQYILNYLKQSDLEYSKLSYKSNLLYSSYCILIQKKEKERFHHFNYIFDEPTMLTIKCFNTLICISFTVLMSSIIIFI